MNNRQLLRYLSGSLNKMLQPLPDQIFSQLQEVRVRVNRPLIIISGSQEYFVGHHGLCNIINEAYCPDTADIRASLELMSKHSIYAFEEEILKGYLTLPGGHRVGLSGRVVVEKGAVKTIRSITCLNLRVSRQILGAADGLLKFIGLPEIYHTMIISPPACGKTTVLRDLIRQLSSGRAGEFIGQTVGVVDERSELGGSYEGVPQNDLGPRTDILDACPKAEGMIMLLRSMSPKIIAVDEIGGSHDVTAIEQVINSGVKIICTVHGKDLNEVRSTSPLDTLISKDIFKRFFVLEGPGRLAGAWDNKFNRLEGSQCLKLSG